MMQALPAHWSASIGNILFVMRFVRRVEVEFDRARNGEDRDDEGRCQHACFLSIDKSGLRSMRANQAEAASPTRVSLKYSPTNCGTKIAATVAMTTKND